MIRVNVKELEGIKILEYDLYTDKGRLICSAGTPLTAGKILQLSYIKLFRKEGDVLTPVVQVKESDPILDDEEIVPSISNKILDEPEDWDSKIDKTVKEEVLTSTRDFLIDIQTGKTPDTAICEV
ncbi:MAG: hypothetical protein AB7V50_00745, partial [Vampirovibrionia bacterium]